MISKSKKTWLGTIVLASILMMLAFMGGNWGTSFAKPSEPFAAPVITSIDPTNLLVTNTNTLFVIRGANFGPADVTRVRFYQWGGDTYELVPQLVQTNLILIDLPGSMTNHPTRYDVVVMVYSSVPTVPTLPTIPGLDSNKVTFSAYEPIYNYMPFLRKR